MPQSLSMRQLAKLAGVSQSTVSLALRHHPSITAATRERIQRLAAEAGYQPNAMVSTVLGSVRRKTARKWSLAWLNGTRSRDAWQRLPYLSPFLLGARQRAAEMGCSIDEFWSGEPHLTEKRLASILHARGIDGIIFAGGDPRPIHDFSSIGVGYSCEPVVGRRVNPDLFHNVRFLISELARRGFQRILFINSEQNDQRACGLISAAARSASATFVPPRAFLYMELDENSPDRSRRKFLSELARFQPEVVACALDSVAGWCATAGIAIPRDLQMAQLFATAQKGTIRWSGVDHRMEAVGAKLVDELIAQLSGAPVDTESIELLIKGRWVEGETLKKQ